MNASIISAAVISAGDDGVDVLGDRGVDAGALGQGEQRGARLRALGDLAGGRVDLLGGHALAELLAEGPVARQRRGAGGDQVAEAGQAHQRQRVGAERHRQPGGLGEAAGDHRGGGVVAEAEADGHADREGDDVLVGAAELAAEHVDAGVGPERRRVARAPAASSRRPRRRRRPREAAGSRRAISLARLGPLTTAIRSGPAPVTSRDHLAHPLEGAELDALHQRHHHGVARDAASRPLGEVLAQRLRRHREHDDLGAVQRLLGVVGRADASAAARCRAGSRCSRAAR